MVLSVNVVRHHARGMGGLVEGGEGGVVRHEKGGRRMLVRDVM